MSYQRKNNYNSKHKRINNFLVELKKYNYSACVSVYHMALMLRMDYRTVKSHLKVMETDGMGAFIDTREKVFCTKEGINRLAKKMKSLK